MEVKACLRITCEARTEAASFEELKLGISRARHWQASVAASRAVPAAFSCGVKTHPRAAPLRL